MNNVILFDDGSRDHLLPLTYVRPVCELRVGILKIRQKWERWLNAKSSFITQDYLTAKYPIRVEKNNYVINGSVLPSDRLCRLVEQLDTNEALMQNGELIAAHLNDKQFEHLMKEEEIEELQGFELEDDTPFLKINRLHDLFHFNDQAIREDFELLTKDRTSQRLSSSNRLIGSADDLFIEEGATVECAVLNTTTGPIYIGKDALVMEGALIRGPFAMNEKAIVKMGAKVYGATTLGRSCKLGGEINNSILMDCSSKGHEGYLGNSVLGQWCNLGADTNNSNLKNNYAEVKLWDYALGRFAPTGLQFCGLIMGDHSKCGINTMFNTGTVVGVAANIFGAGYPRNFIPSFAWGGTNGYTTHKLTAMMETAERVMERRQRVLEEEDRGILRTVFEQTAGFRSWEKVLLQ
ncbi:MAG: GlmU family protein [Bacteroidota bacterium]